MKRWTKIVGAVAAVALGAMGCDIHTGSDDAITQQDNGNGGPDVQADSGGPDVPPTACSATIACLATSYCATDGCDGPGTCQEKPESCTGEYAPVCGCDGLTYSNKCVAAQAGVSPASVGPCDCQPSTCQAWEAALDSDGDGCADDGCGPIECSSNDACSDTAFCFLADGCEGKGVCAPRGDACPAVEEPVCGCDGVSYSNACVAGAAGVNVARDGLCECEPLACLPGQVAVDSDDDGCADTCQAQPCQSNDECPGTERTMCNMPGCLAPGACIPRPLDCPEIYSPVCGCDGKTYASECFAWAAAVSILKYTACECAIAIDCLPGFSPIDTDGDGCPDTCEAQPCYTNDDCGGTEITYCATGGCGVEGQCAQRPGGCPDVWAPVCGCDSETYGNACEAATAGTNVAYPGACACDPIACEPGTGPVDTDGDGCFDGCKPLGCQTNHDCPDHTYCSKDSCDGLGSCAPRPEACTLQYDPVCGCDGQTHGNACSAASAGVNVAHPGVCQCNIVIDCVPGFVPVDTDGDGCADACKGAPCHDDGDCGGPNGLTMCRKESCDGNGACAIPPTACPDVWDPVCGCDGNTYSNDCDAAAARVNVAHEGECGNVCGTIAGIPCGEGEFCEFPGGTCHWSDNGGECVPVPSGCPDVWDPVCGCDGNTYGNDCERQSAQVQLDHEGACSCPFIVDCAPGYIGVDTDGDGCIDGCVPAPCNSNDDCGSSFFGMYCAKDGCHGEGTCAPKPGACIAVWDPVCGCDGETYGNPCAAAAAGVNVASDGECGGCSVIIDCAPGFHAVDTDGDGCPDTCKPNGCTVVIDCAPGYVAIDTDGDGCNDACEPLVCDDDGDCGVDWLYCAKEACDGKGHCATMPTVCPLAFIPVCGCDGQTYDNACAAAAAGVNVAHDGACTLPCDGFAGIACPGDQWCEHPSGTCLFADMSGTCIDVPDGCPENWDPVCGCDGETYGNDCERQAAMVQLDHDGPCGCLIVVDCLPGYHPYDSDGDGCDDSCKPLPCETNADCGASLGLTYCKTDGCSGLGQCALRPHACLAIYLPVCGCNGATYGNACQAAAAGVNVAFDGACGMACGGIAGVQCPDGYFCENDEDSCLVADAAGECVEVPTGCPDVWDPVCGCDGVTYGNDCDRRAAKVQKAHDGECGVCADIVCPAGTTPVDTDSDGCADTCAPIHCEANADCGSDELYCAKSACDDGTGVCAVRPTFCTAEWAPVCGCDGDTYSNACHAATAGVNVEGGGVCEGQVCAGFAGIPCGAGLWCDFDPGTCQWADQTGVCVEIPAVCPDVWDPVCGCDGTTYGNDCERQMAMVPKDKDGTCGCLVIVDCAPGYTGVDSDGDGCVDSCIPIACETNDECEVGGYFCRKDGCDGLGHCQPKPDACLAVYEPVCGCDGQTYSNSCVAASAGVNVASAGACEDSICGGLLGVPCAAGHFCELPAGSCNSADMQGICVATSDACQLLWDPVCGCDGKTYANDCIRRAEYIQKDHDGACDCDPVICPLGQDAVDLNGDGCADTCQSGDCEHDAHCNPGEYCAKGGCSGVGVCKVMPDACTAVYQPVCGCDGDTYGNGCEAAAAGINIASQGACTQFCDGFAGIQCVGDHQWCEHPAGTCNVADMGGECTDVPEVCPTVIERVCGCDGTSYKNDCLRQQAGVQKAHDGACDATVTAP